MALSKKDLQDIEILLEKHLHAGLTPVNTRLDSLEGTTKTLIADVAGLKDSVTGLQQTVAGLQQNMENNTNMINALKSDVIRFDHTIVPSVDLLLDYFKDIIDDKKRLEKVEAVQEDHGSRIWAIERKLKAN